ncbi:hypothetical protein [Actinacidiphila bryophytorum]|uniref:Tetratricopeptide repeat protein n=1 Tax=Actinacidiphila bryophytorum TaxID=1436133 RepID=A0A9W4H6N2_9ACTN|nr:hypothetical protein [Actinacidiphila bryophytorum]MBM9436824.1 hypothetical protein [Actinacidiphila bryophytorum]MBN6542333.1 hypothetical protein [Actinacidiphila bryophytorum]CAG7654463.1 hypothetical protein SBRY_60483 [Actinacidiphila bryophytorum]
MASAQDALARITADALLAAWPEGESDTDLAQALRSNTEALTRVAESALYQSGAHAVLLRTARSLGEAGQIAEAVAYFERVAEVTGVRSGADHADVIRSFRERLADWRAKARKADRS